MCLEANPIYLVHPRHAQELVSLVILDLVSLTININHHTLMCRALMEYRPKKVTEERAWGQFLTRG